MADPEKPAEDFSRFGRPSHAASPSHLTKRARCNNKPFFRTRSTVAFDRVRIVRSGRHSAMVVNRPVRRMHLPCKISARIGRTPCWTAASHVEIAVR